jgi:hypothetical protein
MGISIRTWLRRMPQPTKLRLTLADGAIKTVAIDMKSSRKWSDAEENILRLHPVLVEAMNAKGEIHRTTPIEQAPAEPEEDAEGGEVEDDETKAEKLARTKYGVRATRDLQLAKIIAGAFKEGAQLNNEANSIATNKLFDLVTVMSQRLNGLEVAYQTAMGQIGAYRASVAEGGEPGAMEQVLPLLLARAFGGALPAAPSSGTTKKNGAG